MSAPLEAKKKDGLKQRKHGFHRFEVLSFKKHFGSNVGLQ
jgi:hypothetical protein